MAKKIPVGIRVDPDLIERLRNTVWHVGHGVTITLVVEEAMKREIRNLERMYNEGKPFPVRNGEVVKSPLGKKKKKERS